MDKKNKMNLGSQLAAAGGAPEHAQMIDDMLGQLLIVLIKRAGGSVKIPVAEIDGTAQDLLAFRVDKNKIFHFEISKKA